MQYDYYNEAYDLSLFDINGESNKNNVIEMPRNSFNVEKVKKLKITNMLSLALCSTVLVTIVFTMVYTQVRLTELTEEINIATKKLEEEESIYTQLQMKADSELSLRIVEDYAKNNLNMAKAEPSQINYIKLDTGNKGQVKGKSINKGLFSKIKDIISSVVS